MEACVKAVADGVRYVPGPGLPELREAIAEEATKRGRPTVREEVLVTMGAKHALTQSLLTIVDQGDEVIFPNPGYPPDEFWITYAGGSVVYAPLVEPDFAFDLESLHSLDQPAHQDADHQLAPAAQRHDRGPARRDRGPLPEHNVIVLTDEIFSHMVYAPAEHRTIAAVDGMADRSILVDTFSKTYIMTGFRIGWCVANKDLITTMDIFQQNSVTNVPAFVQLAALAAITGPQGSRRGDHRAPAGQARHGRRGAQRDARHRVPDPEGSFYVFPDIRGTGMTAQQFADYMIESHQVGVVAGSAFGDRGEAHPPHLRLPGRRPRGGARPHPPGGGQPLGSAKVRRQERDAPDHPSPPTSRGAAEEQHLPAMSWASDHGPGHGASAEVWRCRRRHLCQSSVLGSASRSERGCPGLSRVPGVDDERSDRDGGPRDRGHQDRAYLDLQDPFRQRGVLNALYRAEVPHLDETAGEREQDEGAQDDPVHQSHRRARTGSRPARAAAVAWRGSWGAVGRVASSLR